MSFLELAKQRYSVRNYLDKEIEQGKMDLVLEAGRIAPTAANKQPQRIILLHKQDELEKVDEATPCRFGAPYVLLICSDTKDAWTRDRYDGRNYGETDCAIVATHMALQAAEIGLGTVMVAHFDPQRLRAELDLGNNLDPVLLLPIGYPTEAAAPMASHEAKKAMSELVSRR